MIPRSALADRQAIASIGRARRVNAGVKIETNTNAKHAKIFAGRESDIIGWLE